MTLREPAPIPVAFDFTRFLASSITFMTHLSEVVVHFDDKMLVRLAKSSGISKQIGIPNGLQNLSPLGIMSVKDLKSTRIPSSCSTFLVTNFVFDSATHQRGGDAMGVFLRVRKATKSSRITSPQVDRSQELLFFPLYNFLCHSTTLKYIASYSPGRGYRSSEHR